MSETRRRFPCDDVVPDPALEAWRGVTVRTDPQRVWPWVAQIQSAPYSYDWIDNLGRRSPQRLCGLPDPVVGASFTTVFRGRAVGKIITVVPGEHLTGEIVGAVMSYVLVAEGSNTRLLLKIVMRRGRAIAPLLCLGDLIMSRRQLLNLARLAEQASTS